VALNPFGMQLLNRELALALLDRPRIYAFF
jgi:hypothetical protein